MDLVKAIATLPQSKDPHDTYVFLARLHIKGTPVSSCNCPLATYLNRVTAVTEGVIYADYGGTEFPNWYTWSGPGDLVALPEGVGVFMEAFDQSPSSYPAVWQR